MSRLRWLFPFALLLFATSSVPVLADSRAEDSPPSSDLELLEAEPVPYAPPDAAALAVALAKLEREEGERARWLESPVAAAERQASRLSYESEDSAAQASALLVASFAEQLAGVDLDPARVLTDATLKRAFEGGGAVISNEGRTELIEAEMPARVPDESGQPRKVDLSLEATGDGFAPRNPILDLHIPASAEAGIAVEGGETTIAQVGADPQSTAHPLGEKDVIYPEVQTDTDLIVAPLSNGVELFDQLRSVKSPETLRFDLDLPKGSELRESAGSVEIYEGERLAAAVMPPYALDAQGTSVPVEMEVEGSTLVLSVPHREGDYAYPILVDPEYVQNDWVNYAWIWGHNYHVLEGGAFQAWSNNSKLLTDRWCIYACWGSGRGLFVSAQSGSYAGNKQADWTFTPPGETSYLSGYLINPTKRDDHGCSAGSYPQPHDFDGLWSPAHQIYYQLYTNRAAFGNAATYGNTAKTAKVMVFGLNTGGGTSIPCWRDIYAGGVATYMTDPDDPTIEQPTGFPSGWFDDTKTHDLNVAAEDKGLGVKNIWMVKEGSAPKPLKQTDCYGTFDSPCYRNMSGPIPFDGDDFDEGKTLVKATTHDALARPANSSSWWAHVDNLPPKVTLSGQLAAATNEGGSEEQPPGQGDELSLPVYNLTIEAKDGSNASNGEMRSGVKAIKVLLDESQTPLQEWTQSCPASSCSMTKTYPLALHGLAPGQHTLRVLATDQLDHKRERKIEFEYIPATGMKDEYVMHYFPLPDGLGDEDEEEFPDRPELAVNLMNGNLVYRELDVDVEGAAVDLEVERYYNSQLPEAQSGEWGRGWTLAQTPELEPEEVEGSQLPEEAELLDQSGALQGGVELPTEVGEGQFDPALRATLTKEADGYELSDETGESDTSIAFDANGRTEELRTEGYAKVEYDYAQGALAEIAVEDPGAASEAPPPPPLPDSLPDPVAAYSFDEGEGKVLHDSSSGEHHGVLCGPPTWSANGRYGGALDFDGKEDLVTIPDHADLDLTDSFTIEAWVRPDELSGPLDPVLSKVDYLSSSVGYALRARYLGPPAGHAKGSEGAKNVIGDAELPEEAWSHLAFTSDGEELRLYVDGELVETAEAKLPAVTSADLQLGYGLALGTPAYFDGLIDEVRLYDEPLTAAQIAVQGEAPEEEGPPTEPDDPSVAIETDDGLVRSLEGTRAGEHTYEHDGDLLTSHEGPNGETTYEYDSAGRMTKVTLANGTWAEIEYGSTYGRVESVEVDPAGEKPAKTTYFEFSDEPRRTTVTPPGEPVVTYDIGPDGSILKWQNAIVVPEISLTGSLAFSMETPSPISTGLHNLLVNAYSEEGIESIQVVANGSQLVDEKSCEQDPEKPGVECVEVLNEWVTETQNHAPGILHLEAIVEDRLGQVAVKRFWVNIPEPPPPPPHGSPPDPTFAEILDFREEFGLDIVDPVKDEEERNDRIFNLINAWTEGDPVARATMERWGVPLRTRDVAELEYRERYLAHNGPLISQWGESNTPSTYAGYYIDHKAGGKLRIGFTADQASLVEDLKVQGGLTATDRIAPFAATPIWPLTHLQNAAGNLAVQMAFHPGIRALLTSSRIDVKENMVLIGSTDPTTVNVFLDNQYGESREISAILDPNKPTLRSEEDPRERELDNRLFAGDLVTPQCTMGFGAWERKSKKTPNGQSLFAHFALGAGHCWALNTKVRRIGIKQSIKDSLSAPFGTVRRKSDEQLVAGYETDAAAIRLDEGTEVPRWIYWSPHYQSMINGSEAFTPGMTLCYSGSSTGTQCASTEPTIVEAYYAGSVAPTWQIQINAGGEGGDSGGPVWNPVTGGAVGLVTGGPPYATWVTPLLNVEDAQTPQIPAGAAPGALNAPGMKPPLAITSCCR